MPGFAGLKITQDLEASALYPATLHLVRLERKADHILVAEPGLIGYGGNGGFHAINLAVQFGATPIILVGFDMRLDKGIHWHGPHRGTMRNPDQSQIVRWRRVVDGAAGQLRSLGVEVLNASPDSALTAYRKVTFEEALCRLPTASCPSASRTAATRR